MEYGTGAVQGVPTHDQRDFEFARKYGIPLIVVVQPPGQALDEKTMTEATRERGSGQLGPVQWYGERRGKGSDCRLSPKERGGWKRITYRLKDWGISRQRYWEHRSPSFTAIDVERSRPGKGVAVILPEDVEVTGMGQSPLAS